MCANTVVEAQINIKSFWVFQSLQFEKETVKKLCDFMRDVTFFNLSIKWSFQFFFILSKLTVQRSCENMSLFIWKRVDGFYFRLSLSLKHNKIVDSKNSKKKYAYTNHLNIKSSLFARYTLLLLFFYAKKRWYFNRNLNIPVKYNNLSV